MAVIISSTFHRAVALRQKDSGKREIQKAQFVRTEDLLFQWNTVCIKFTLFSVLLANRDSNSCLCVTKAYKTKRTFAFPIHTVSEEAAADVEVKDLGLI